MLVSVGLCHPLQLPVTLWPSACLSKEAKAFYSIVRWKWKSVSVRNCSSVSASSLLKEERKKKKRQKAEKRESMRGLLALSYTINLNSLLYLTLLISLIILVG